MPLPALRLFSVSLNAFLLFSLFTQTVTAQPAPDDGTRAAARELGRQGIDAYLEGKYKEARENLDRAYRLFATPTLGLWSARSLEQLGEWVEAAERYRETLRLPASMGDTAVQQSALAEAAVELDALVGRLPAITIEIRGAVLDGVTLTLDGRSIPTALVGVRRPMNPGEHRVHATRGSEHADARVKLAEAEHQVLNLQLSKTLVREPAVALPASKPTPVSVPSKPTSQPDRPSHVPRLAAGEESGFPVQPLAFAALAVGGAGILTSGITALSAQGECAGGRCNAESDQANYDVLRMASSICFWAGATLAVGGAGLWLLSPTGAVRHKDGIVSWTISPLGFHISGAL